MINIELNCSYWKTVLETIHLYANKYFTFKYQYLKPFNGEYTNELWFVYNNVTKNIR